MGKKYKIIFSILLLLAITWLGLLFIDGSKWVVLNPKGIIALKEYRLMVFCTWMMLIVVVPVLIITLVFAWRYRADNTKAKYNPEEDQNHVAEVIWWGIPFVIITILGIVTWKSCLELDPFKPLESEKKPLKIQVVALQWKWLFIYPEQKIATVNFVQFPEQTPVNFEISADAPMNSFWIPQLGGQIYAMPGMVAKLHLMADEAGDYWGSSANLSGKGFAGMRFAAKSCSAEDFNSWVDSVKQQSRALDYAEIAEPSAYVPPAYYKLSQENLFEQIVMKYMVPQRSEEK
ncbi:MAG: ubiquinol oxidase subunit II [Verrucomicrobia bacterium]|nr:ubiquinol oxidase subunit II [Verrucomicrobiota bacterium]